MRFVLPVIVSVFFAAPLTAQFENAIEDNSFYIEEAYNQEEGIVQHIFNGFSPSNANLFEASFTQEWPVYGREHQLSYTLPYTSSAAADGIGDIMINYRYQLMNDNGLALSPRISLILPTGDEAAGLGSGVAGVQVNFPVSKRWSNEFVTHINAGLTLLPNVNTGTDKETHTEYFTGISGILLASYHVNLMTEILYTSTRGTDELIVSPGLRCAVDIGDLQIVPGLTFPFIFATSKQENGVFCYISFEHFF